MLPKMVKKVPPVPTGLGISSPPPVHSVLGDYRPNVLEKHILIQTFLDLSVLQKVTSYQTWPRSFPVIPPLLPPPTTHRKNCLTILVITGWIPSKGWLADSL